MALKLASLYLYQLKEEKHGVYVSAEKKGKMKQNKNVNRYVRSEKGREARK